MLSTRLSAVILLSIALASVTTASFTCDPHAQSSLEWVCRDGRWSESVNSQPSSPFIVWGGETTQMDGNLTASVLVFKSLSASLNVSGCASNLTSIIINIPRREMGWLRQYSGFVQNLVRHSSEPSCSDLSSVTVYTSYPKVCKRVFTETFITNEQLSATHIFRYTCDLPLVIVFSVFGALALVTAISVCCYFCICAFWSSTPPSVASEVELDETESEAEDDLAPALEDPAEFPIAELTPMPEPTEEEEPAVELSQDLDDFTECDAPELTTEHVEL